MIKNPNPNKPLPPRADGTTAPRFRLATVREATQYARIGKTRLYKLMKQGTIIFVKDDSRRKVDLDSIDAYYASLLRGHAESSGADL
jgi:excisionase family DNA binding protein